MKTKDEYLLRNFSKITHKKWELFVITRILHTLNDPDIEYVCQQYINPKNSVNAYLADICFPTLKLYYEIDEGQHASAHHINNDKIRQREILEATDWEEYRIKVFDKKDPTKVRSISDVIAEVDEFVNFIRKRKIEIEKKEGIKIKWNFEDRFKPEPHLEKGKIQVSGNVVFLYIRDCLRLFGYDGGHYQGGWWRIKKFNEAVWFPKLYPNKQWRNLLSDDRQIITQEQVIENRRIKHSLPSNEERICFAHYKNVFGQTVYKYYGSFIVDWDNTDEYFQTFKRVSDELDLKKYIKPN